jgi:Ca2+-transporting ATPase
VKGLLSLLGVSPKAGVSSKEVEGLRTKYGSNEISAKKLRSFLAFVVDAANDKLMLLLLLCAFISILLGVAFATEEGAEWIEGVAIFVAVAIVVMVTATNDYAKQSKFAALEQVRDATKVRCRRDGTVKEMFATDLVVGDIVLLETGAKIPADCVLIYANTLSCDESSMTGESRAVRKEVDVTPFLLSGTYIAAGNCEAVVGAVGKHSQYGMLRLALRTGLTDDGDEKPPARRLFCLPPGPVDEVQTPLQERLSKLADRIAYMGVGAAILTFLALLIKWIVTKEQLDASVADSDASVILSFVIVAVTILVVAVPEGLPLAVTVALSYSMRRMLQDNNLVRHLSACETMGSATDICSDKTGTLTKNQMTLTSLLVGNGEKDHGNGSSAPKAARPFLAQSISSNSTAELGAPAEEGDPRPTFIGSATECAILAALAPDNYTSLRSGATVVRNFPFDSSLKRSGVLVDLPTGERRFFAKGAGENVVKLCTRAWNAKATGTVELDDKARETLLTRVNDMSGRGLRVLALAHRDMSAGDEPAKEPAKKSKRKKGKRGGSAAATEAAPAGSDDEFFSNLVLTAIVGIQDPLRDDVKDAVQACRGAGITVRMLTGDNLITARHIAKEADIFREGDVAMTGSEVRELSDSALDTLLSEQNLTVVARCSPLDKQRLVKRLRLAGHVVASTGDGTNDAPQLKLADVGFAMGIAGTEVAKEASDIVLMTDSFSSIVRAVVWGRNVFESVRAFLQFQLTVNVVAVIMSFISAMYLGFSVLSSVQLLWLNLVMDTLGALALATSPPDPSLLKRKPAGRDAPLITPSMWRFISLHAALQLLVLLSLTIALQTGGLAAKNTLFFENATFPEPTASRAEPSSGQTVVFNTFLWMQIFNLFNARILNSKPSPLHGLGNNFTFWGVVVIIMVVQTFMVVFGGDFTSTVKLTGKEWAGCLVYGGTEFVWGVIVRLLPLRWFGQDDESGGFMAWRTPSRRLTSSTNV